MSGRSVTRREQAGLAVLGVLTFAASGTLIVFAVAISTFRSILSTMTVPTPTDAGLATSAARTGSLSATTSTPPAESRAATAKGDAVEKSNLAVDCGVHGYCLEWWQSANASTVYALGLLPDDADLRSVEKQIDKYLPVIKCEAGEAERARFAAAAEEAFLASGVDARVTATGKCGTTYRVNVVFCGRPMVYDMSHGDNVKMLRASGFKKVVCDDGFGGQTWAEF